MISKSLQNSLKNAFLRRFRSNKKYSMGFIVYYDSFSSFKTESAPVNVEYMLVGPVVGSLTG